MKKIFFFLITIIFYYLILTTLVFSFSYISLINGKTYDLFWVKSIQKKIYYRGYRNIWQYNNNCTSYDENLLYKPKIGSCNFSNPEFSTKLNFDEYSRKHSSSEKYSKSEDYLLVLGDSIAMGWGVNDDKTFSYLLEKSLNKKVYNLAVSSYGTVREIKRMLLSPYYENSKTIIIQYHPNDLFENEDLNLDKVYSKNDYKEIFEEEDDNFSTIGFILKNYKSSIRLFFADIIDIFFKEDNLEIINFNEDKKYLEKVIRKNINLEEKQVIVFLPIAAHQKVINFPKISDKIQYILIELNKSNFFNIDDHPNEKGHSKIANILFNFLKN